MAPEKHAWFSPSAASANILCPARAKKHAAMEAEFGSTSVHAELGTQCHEIMEAHVSSPGKVPELMAELKEDWQAPAIQNALAQRMDVIDSTDSLILKTETEAEVDLGYYSKADVFGTVDSAVLYEDGTLVVIDYKFGAGIAVLPRDNAQLMIYALGIVGKWKAEGGVITSVRLVIIQPRIYKEAKVHDISVTDLEAWFSLTLFPAIAAAADPDAKTVPGETQCRWCNAAKGGCEGLTNSLKEMLPSAAVVNAGTPTLNQYELGELLAKLPAVKKAIVSLEDMALRRILAGDRIPGFKAVPNRPKRTWGDPEKASKMLQRYGLKEKERYVKKLISPKKARELVAAQGKMTIRRENAIKKQIVRPDPKPVLVADSDPRPSYPLPDCKVLLPEPVSEPVSINDIF